MKTISYLYILGVILLQTLAFFTGKRISNSKYWPSGYFIPLVLIIIIAIIRWIPQFESFSFFSLLMAGRREFAILSIASSVMFATLFPKLSDKRQHRSIILFMIVINIYFLLPFVLPVFMYNYFSTIKTNIDDNGICHQNTYYTCGPAACVTSLRKLGYEAEEGNIAIMAFTNPMSGTQPDSLAKALYDNYHPVGFACEYKYFSSVEELKKCGKYPVALINYTLFADHYVSILEINDKEIIMGDPLEGKKKLSHVEFYKIWRKSAIIISEK